MSFGSGGTPSPPYIPPPPPKEELMDVIDHITGTEAVTMTGADGKKRRVIQRLPRSPEEEALYRDAGDLMQRSLAQIVELNKYDPKATVDFSGLITILGDLDAQRKEDIAELSNVPDFNAYVDDLKKNNRAILEEEFTRQENQNKGQLDRMGYGDSTAMAETRAALGKNRAQSLVQSDLDASMQGQQLAAQDISNRSNIYNFREQQRAGLLQKAQTEHQLTLSQKDQLDNARQQALQNQFGLFQTGAKIRGDDAAKAMATQAPQLANQIFQQSNADSLNRYNAGVNAQMANYQNQLNAYNSRGPSFGDSMMKLGMSGLGAFGGSYMGAKGLSAAGVDLNRPNAYSGISGVR